MKTLFFATFLAIVFVNEARAFDETFQRYFGPHEIFRTLRDKLKLNPNNIATGDYQNPCVAVGYENKDLLGVANPATGEPVFTNPTPSFVKWYAECLTKTLQAAFLKVNANENYYKSMTPESTYNAILSSGDRVVMLARELPSIVKDENLKALDIEMRPSGTFRENPNARLARDFLEELLRYLKSKEKGKKPPFDLSNYSVKKEKRDLAYGIRAFVINQNARYGEAVVGFQFFKREKRLTYYLDKLLDALGYSIFDLAYEKGASEAEFAALIEDLLKAIDFNAGRTAYIAPNTLINWSFDLDEKARRQLVKKLIYHFIGPYVVKNEDLFITKVLKTVPSQMDGSWSNWETVLKPIIFAICSTEEFLTY